MHAAARMPTPTRQWRSNNATSSPIRAFPRSWLLDFAGPEGPLLAADSIGRCNTFAEHFSRCMEAERLARPLVQLSRDRVELKL